MKMELVGKKVTFAEAEEESLLFWANKSWQERLQETERLRRMIWTYLLGSYPVKMEKVGKVIKWSTKEE
ncbi:MAG: hypothetical protein ACHQD8_00255 [Chitinophagales bacterium]